MVVTTSRKLTSLSSTDKGIWSKGMAGLGLLNIANFCSLLVILDPFPVFLNFLDGSSAETVDADFLLPPTMAALVVGYSFKANPI